MNIIILLGAFLLLALVPSLAATTPALAFCIFNIAAEDLQNRLQANVGICLSTCTNYPR